MERHVYLMPVDLLNFVKIQAKFAELIIKFSGNVNRNYDSLNKFFVQGRF